MTVAQTLADRNAALAAERFPADLRMMPVLKTILIACVDPRVDPERLLGVEPGEVAVIRNVGGRVTPDVLDQLALLRAVTQAAGGDLGAAWELVVLQHTDCGITRLADHPALGGFLGVDQTGLSARAVQDPYAAVAVDRGLLEAETRLGAGITVTGLVYDVATGLVAAA